MEEQFISIQDAMQQGSGDVAIRGWVYRERGSSQLKFVVLRDASNIIQCVIKKNNVGEQMFAVADKLQIETSMEISGTIKEEKRAPSGYEIEVKHFSVVGFSDTFPITKDQSTEFLLDNRHLWLRSRRMVAIMKIRSTVLQGIHKFFQANKYFEFSPPIFTPNACEGGATLFAVNYFSDKEKVYLTQSWQLYAEAAVFGLERIYCISPCFRAETSKTSRHLAEFWMAEMEATWLGLKEVSEMAKELIAFLIETVLSVNKEELKILERDITKLEKIKLPFQTITYTDALKILKEKANMDVEWGKDLRTIEEEELMKHFDKPIIVTHYPKEIMAFYKPRDPQDEKTALCFDMLAPEGYGEIAGGSQRETEVDELLKYLKMQGEKPDNYAWYFDLRKYGSVPHAGFGMGIERVIAWICGLDNIKDAIAFPRTMLRKTP